MYLDFDNFLLFMLEGGSFLCFQSRHDDPSFKLVLGKEMYLGHLSVVRVN